MSLSELFQQLIPSLLKSACCFVAFSFQPSNLIAPLWAQLKSFLAKENMGTFSLWWNHFLVCSLSSWMGRASGQLPHLSFWRAITENARLYSRSSFAGAQYRPYPLGPTSFKRPSYFYSSIFFTTNNHTKSKKLGIPPGWHKTPAIPQLRILHPANSGQLAHWPEGDYHRPKNITRLLLHLSWCMKRRKIMRHGKKKEQHVNVGNQSQHINH